jgi:methyl-accepting chemotaxis protein
MTHGMTSISERFGVRWTVGRRIAALGALAVAALTAVGGLGYLQAGRSWQHADEAFRVASTLSTVIDSQHAASVMVADAYRLTTPLTAAQRTAVVDQLDEHAGEMSEQLATLEPTHLAGLEPAALADLTDAMQAVLATVPALDKTTGPPPRGLLGQVQASWDAFDEASDAVRSQLAADSSQRNEATQLGAQSTRRLILLVALSAIPLMGLAMWLIARAVAGPVRQTRAVLERVADGDFTQRIAQQAPDDLGELAAAVNTTVTRVGDAIGAIGREAGVLAAASQRLDGVSEQVAAGAQRVTSEAGSVSGNAEHVSDDIQTVAAGCDQMQAAIGEISRNAAEAAGIVDEAVQIAQTANGIMNKLDTSSAEIEEVAKVITSIADQTNLLALNATIEAARAGDAGKGFAVVASEVKELAQETAKATEGIGRRIETIQADSADAVTALNRITETINRIQEIQQTIASSVEEQSASTREISVSVSRVAGRAGEIATRISNVAEASSEATTAADATHHAARELADSASSLQGIVSGFRISPHDSSAASGRPAPPPAAVEPVARGRASDTRASGDRAGDARAGAARAGTARAGGDRADGA